MFSGNSYPLSVYQDMSPLCEKGHVILVQNQTDEHLYVKKYLRCYNEEIYRQLRNNPVKNVPRIAGIYKEESEDILIIIEEYYMGFTIAELLEKKGVFSEKETIRIALELSRILQDLQEQTPAIIHRDIKPSNVIITSKNEVKLIDFNAAKTENEDKNRDTVLIGTAGYAAPEQYGFAASSPQTDIYAFGVLLNIMLTGELPSETLAKGKLRKVICHCLEMNPKDRYLDAKELYFAIKKISMTKLFWLPPGFRTLRIHRMLVALLGYSLIFLFASFVKRHGFDTVFEWRFVQSVMILFPVSIIFFYCNYFNIQQWFPFMRASRRSHRIAGFIIAPILISWIFLTVIMIFTLNFF